MPAPILIYHRAYNISALGLERLHPFDSRKYGRAMKVLRQTLGRKELQRHVIAPRAPVSRAELLHFHTPAYLQKLRSARYLAGALEVPQLARVPAWVLDWLVLRPMRWATAGTILGATLAFQHRLVFNLSGGYHHASAEQGEGFSIYNDIALAIHEIRREGLLGANERIAYVDCDAHQGNAVCHAFFEDPRVFIYDCYNPRIYPVFDVKAKRRIDCNARVLGPSDDSAYLQHLQGTLPSFLDGISRSEAIRFAIYNAGTDVLAGDMLGMMNVTENGVLQRDIYVIDQLLSRGMAVLVLPSGGYTRQSYRLIANTLLHYLQRSEP